MKLKLVVAAAVATAAMSLSAAAQDWKLVSLDDQQLTFTDGGRVARNPVAASLWVLESYPEVRHVGEGWYPHRSRSLRYVFNCSEETYAIAQWILHQGALGHGDAVWADRATAPAFAQVHAGDPQAALLAAACSGTALAQHGASGRVN
ncbi:MAG TPA: surface-adhesin E family protein [Burkholderiales bacterium]|nr:surface-adhesin E family protein [Burkholderiales bacterium]